MKISANIIKGFTLCLALVLVNAVVFKEIWSNPFYSTLTIMGGVVQSSKSDSLNNLSKSEINPDDSYTERFLRPSSSKPLEKKYIFNNKGHNLPDKFTLPVEVVRAYYDILSDAANMEDKKGGCGSIGFGKTPYPAAYDLLSQNLKNKMPYERFLKSFEGIGHINLLKIVEIPSIKEGTEVYPGFFVEIETVEGTDTTNKTIFAYYHGFVRVEQGQDKGWKISKIELEPEDFLCHAYHGWSYDAKAVVEIIYGQQKGIIEKVLSVEEDAPFINVLAKGKDGKQYRFQFIRITNGADIELRQYVMSDGKWKEIYIDANKSVK